MNNQKTKKITTVVNISLVVIFTCIFAVSFIPNRIVPIYSGKNNSAIYNGNRENKQVSLMFNVYENTDIVNGIIDTLNANNVKATFFVGGCWADDNNDTVNRIVLSGHEIANHGYFHKDHAKLDYAKNKEEILYNANLIEHMSSVKMNLFAPPSGSYSSTTLEVCKELDYKLIMWSKDTIDWRDKDEDLVFTRATKNLSNGDLVLMHPKKHTLNVLERILNYYESSGFSIVTVSENIKGL